MRLTIPKSTLLPVLAHAKAAADAKSTMAALGTVRLAATGDRLTATATDLNITTISTVPAAVGKPGTICVDAARIYEVAAKLPAGDVVLTLEERELIVRAGKSTSRLICLASPDHPTVPDPDKADFARCAAGPLAAAIARTVPATSTDESKHALAAVAFLCRGTKERMVATDGNRAALDELTLGLPAHREILIPRRGASVIRDAIVAADELELELAITGHVLMVRAGSTVVAVKLIDAAPMPIEQVIPKKHARRAVCNRKELIDAIARAAVMMERDDKELNHAMKLTLGDGAVILDATHKDYGSTREEVEADIKGDAVAIGVRPRFLRDALAAVDADECAIEAGGRLDAFVVRAAAGGGALTVIMPMRI